MAAEQPQTHLEPPPWLKTLPVAPEFRPTLAEFLDPIAFILKIEKEASQYGICKIIPPLPPPSKNSALTNLTRSFASLMGSSSSDPLPTFATRKQQVGLCPRRPRPVQRAVWQSGERYNLPQFEDKVRQFERAQLRRVSSTKKSFSPLEVETLYWRSCADKPFTIEYANDMPGSGFEKQSENYIEGDGEGDQNNVGETAWNMRGVSRARGSLLRFMKEEIPGVTSPMVYVAMMYSWFAWHVEDHDLHSMNYLHFGGGKTWYGVPRDARLAFEDAVRVHGYGEEVNPLVTFTMLGEKTTVMSPEVLVGAGIPCCRLVQNAGEFVVTFPGAYHSGFSHGFNCAEAANIATPGWLGVAKDAAIRRASTNTPPMVSHYQLLYSLALSVWPRAPKSTPSMEPKSSRLKGKVKNEVETMVKETFVESMMQNNNLISMLVDRGGSCMILPHRLSDDISGKIAMKSKLGFGQYQKGLFNKRECDIESGLLDGGLLSCVMCGILSFACVAVVQPREKAARYLMTTTNCSFFKDRSGTSDDSSDVDAMPSWDADPSNLFTSDAGQGLNIANNSNKIEETNNNTALALLASAYSASDSEEEVLNDNVTGCSFLRSCSNGQFTGEDHRVKEESTIDVLSCDKDSSRKHVFCLEHALKVWRELQNIGGADIILLCHPEYPKIEAEAKRMARELGMIYHWKEFNFRESTEQHQKQIKSALEDEEAVPTKSDWAVKMGINLYYSANQSKSPLYSKQMPYNAIIYKAFGQQMVGEFERPRQGRQKKIVVAGRWCGKVWMTNQVHPYLACLKEEKDDVDSEGEQLYFRVPVDNIEHIGCVSGGSSSKSRVLKRVSGSKRKEPVGPKRRSQRVTGVKPEISQTVVVTDQTCSTTTRIVTDQTCSMTTRSQRVRRKPAKYASSYVSEDEQEEQGGEKEEKGESKGETSSSHKYGTARKSRSVRKSRVSDESILDEIEHDNKDESEKESVRKRGRKSRSVQKTRVSDESILKEIEHHSDDESEKELVRTTGRTTGRKSRSVQKTRISYESILNEIKHDSEDESEEEPVQSKGRKKTLKQEIETNLEFKCDIEFCPMSFKTKQELTTHKRNICPIKGCGKKFFSHKYMVSHHKVHLDDRPLKCPWKGCKMAFKWPWARTEHIRVHTGARPYVCKEPGCVQTFRFVSDFSRHKRKTGHDTKGNKREK